MLRGRVVLLVVTASCGRIGYDDQQQRAVGPDAGDDTALDAAADAAILVCPSDTTEVSVGSSVCIELVERGTVTWTAARDACVALGRRLCADLEWYAACVEATGVIDMIDGGYEWVAEESGGVALKRGTTDCTVMSSHEIFVDPYEYRCCVEKQP